MNNTWKNNQIYLDIKFIITTFVVKLKLNY